MLRPTLFILALALLLVPTIGPAYAAFPFFPSESTPLLPCSGDGSQPGPRKCSSPCDLLELIRNLTDFGMTIAAFIIGPIFGMWAGILMVVDGGSGARLKQGKKMLIDTSVGIAITLGAYLIISTFLWGLGIVTGGAGNIPAWPNVVCRSDLPGLAPVIPNFTPPAPTTAP